MHLANLDKFNDTKFSIFRSQLKNFDLKFLHKKKKSNNYTIFGKQINDANGQDMLDQLLEIDNQKSLPHSDEHKYFLLENNGNQTFVDNSINRTNNKEGDNLLFINPCSVGKWNGTDCK